MMSNYGQPILYRTILITGDCWRFWNQRKIGRNLLMGKKNFDEKKSPIKE